jgi:hypothetical protein
MRHFHPVLALSLAFTPKVGSAEPSLDGRNGGAAPSSRIDRIAKTQSPVTEPQRETK